MEVRPSDGIALAIRLDAPILLSESVVDRLVETNDLFYDEDISKTEILYLESQKPQVTLM
jgi:bifunctional DNase/RNase